MTKHRRVFTDSQLAQMRFHAGIEYAMYSAHLFTLFPAGPPRLRPQFTCDDCTELHHCPYVFDLYNTNGDCIAEK